ncbi:hypothetical protein QOL99_15775 [Deinococcus sp. MIMF12]|uniref:Uncharacterized protein n=1 Tax=Deinococcus rhizophilus TaxID=3049544 RepID=A0ABT7JKX9_9DEIO|nr:hypothetical protein [Deinococcus rhizophilus]MDL2345596.1 hypothetical protein [Deinococcus rhizophilus]
MPSLTDRAPKATADERARRLTHAASPDGQRHQVKLAAAREAHRQAARTRLVRALVNTRELSPDQAQATVPEDAQPAQPVTVDGLSFRAAANGSEHALEWHALPDRSSPDAWVHVMDLEHLSRLLLQQGHTLPPPGPS